MPQIFKALVTVSAWAVIIVAWLACLLNFIFGGIMAGYAFGAAPVPMYHWTGYAIAIGYGFLGGFLLLVRKKLE